MRFVFRVDGSLEIGGGHIVRCCNLAKSLKENNNEILFLTQKLSGDFCEYILESGFDVVSYKLKSNFSEKDWWEEDVALIKKNLQKDDALIVDHYFLDAKWELNIRKCISRLVVIDDLADRKHFCDVLIDYNFSLNKDRYEKLVSKDTKLLLGTEFCIINKIFKPHKKSNIRKIKNLLLFFGSNDRYNLNVRCVNEIEKMHEGQYTYDIVVGNKSEFNQELKKLKLQLGIRLNLHIQTDQMPSLMEKADLYIGSGGTVTWERCLKSLPSLVITVAENQIFATQDLHRVGALIYVGAHNNPNILNMLISELNKLSDHMPRYNQISLISSRIVDGNGTDRIAKELV